MATAATTKAAPKDTPKAPAKSVPWTTDIWARMALTYAGLPVTKNNIDNIQRWITSETGAQQGGWWRDNNPLNMTGYGSTPPASSSVFYRFNSLNDSAKAFGTGFMAQQNMAGIRAAFAANAPTPITSAAIQRSPWAGTNGYGGNPLFLTAMAPTTNPANIKVDTVPNNAGIVGQAFGALGLPGGGVVGDVLNATGVTDVTGAVGGVVSTAASGAKVLSNLASGAWWKRIGIGAGGVALIIAGGVLFLSQTQAGKQAAAIATTAATKGAA